MIRVGATITIAAAVLTGCDAPWGGQAGRAGTNGAAGPPIYLGADAERMGEALVNLTLRMRGGSGAADMSRYADCVVSGIALQQGYGFARHVRTNLTDEAGIWLADAVYTLSPALPGGLRTLDADVVATTCREDGIPLV
ncbi:MAG: hypothetical protein KJN93_08465 [Alphaproteobacteria bacterium]|nr:hypothetical protein [Alphaproteobacteria bacterium]